MACCCSQSSARSEKTEHQPRAARGVLRGRVRRSASGPRRSPAGRSRAQVRRRGRASISEASRRVVVVLHDDRLLGREVAEERHRRDVRRRRRSAARWSRRTPAAWRRAAGRAPGLPRASAPSCGRAARSRSCRQIAQAAGGGEGPRPARRPARAAGHSVGEGLARRGGPAAGSATAAITESRAASARGAGSPASAGSRGSTYALESRLPRDRDAERSPDLAQRVVDRGFRRRRWPSGTAPMTASIAGIMAAPTPNPHAANIAASAPGPVAGLTLPERRQRCGQHQQPAGHGQLRAEPAVQGAPRAERPRAGRPSAAIAAARRRARRSRARPAGTAARRRACRTARTRTTTPATVPQAKRAGAGTAPDRPAGARHAAREARTRPPGARRPSRGERRPRECQPAVRPLHDREHHRHDCAGGEPRAARVDRRRVGISRAHAAAARPAGSASATTGTLIQKAALQPKRSSSSPPTTGPSGSPTGDRGGDQRDRAAALGGREERRDHRDRERHDHRRAQAHDHACGDQRCRPSRRARRPPRPAPNSASPASRTRLRPSRSPNSPAGSIAPANASTYASTIHCSSAVPAPERAGDRWQRDVQHRDVQPDHGQCGAQHPEGPPANRVSH